MKEGKGGKRKGVSDREGRREQFYKIKHTGTPLFVAFIITIIVIVTLKITLNAISIGTLKIVWFASGSITYFPENKIDYNKRSVLRRQSRDTNRIVYCRYG